MIISPGEKRDYNVIIEKCTQSINEMGMSFSLSELDEFINLNCTYNKVDTVRDLGMIKIIDCSIGLLIRQYEELLKLYKKDNNLYKGDMLNFYKMIIYDFIDFRNATCNFIGIQLHGIVRSIIEHTRMFLICMFDNDFQGYYFKEYTVEEKRERFYKKRGTKIDDKLKEICKVAVEKGEKMTAKSSLKAINSEDLYKRIHDEFSELTHLSEFTIAKDILNDRLELCFDSDSTWKYNKYYDDIIEYIIVTVIIIFIRNNELVKCKYEDKTIEVYNILVNVYNDLFKYRCMDNVLIELKKKVLEICK